MALSSQWLLEVPLCESDAATLPTAEVPGEEAVYEFAALHEGAARAGKSELRQSSSSSRCLVWQLEGGAPHQLLLQEVGVAEERREAAVRLSFAAPLLPAVSCTESTQLGGTLLAVVTADGTLHTIRHALQAAPPAGSAAAAASLARKLQAPGAVASVPLAAHFQRAGAPTCLLEVGGFICVGTEDGNLVCQPADSADPAAAFLLAPTSALGKVLGGFFGRPTGQAVCHLAELRHLDRRLLAAIHDGSQLRLWDLPSRRLVHSADLLLSGLTGELVPTLARLTGEPLDASTSILLVYFSPRDAASPQPGMLTTYEIFLEQRGEGAYKVLLELGPRLQGSIHRLRDLALENVALHTVGAWLLYDDAQGRRRLDCVPLSFQGGPAEADTHAHLIEDQLLEGCQAEGAACEAEAEAWRAIEARLGDAAELPPALAAAFADAVVAPGRLSRRALHAALAALGSGVEAEAVSAADLATLKAQLPRWLAAAVRLPAAAAAAAGAAAELARWSALLRAYAAAWQRHHLPVALLQLPPQGEPGVLLVARAGGVFTALRGAVAAEAALHSEAPPPEWQQLGAADAEAATPALRAAAAVFRAAGGGQLGRLLWACLRDGLDLDTLVLPAVVHSVAGGHPLSVAAAVGSAGSAARAARSAARRKLPLQLAALIGWEGGSAGFVASLAAALKVLEADWRDGTRIRSPLPAATKPVAWAQLQALAQLAVLQRYVLWSPSLATWSLAPEDAAQLESELLPRTLSLLRAAATAYWAAVTPAPEGGAEGGASGGAAALDPAAMVVSLRIQDGGPAGPAAAAAAAAKRARLAPTQASYVAALLLAAGPRPSNLHVVRDIPDLQRVSLLFAQRLLCLVHSPLHAAAPGAGRRLQPADDPQGGGPPSPDDIAVEVAAELFSGRLDGQLAQLQALLPEDSRDMRLLFFRACSAARQIGLAATPEEQRRLEEDSCSLFFRVAAVFGQASTFPGQAAAVERCARHLLSDGSRGAAAAAELAYHEALTSMYERLGRYDAAARCALAAARQVAAAMPLPEQLAARSSAQGRLWATVFGCCLEGGRLEEAYSSLLSIEVPEVQLDCLHRLLGVLCASPRGVELLCSLPLAHNLSVVRSGRQVWVPMLAEVVGILQRRAAQLDLRASPQPYKVLADFHIARSGYQAAAGAMLAYGRRLVQEGGDDPELLAEAELAQATAVSCLSLVDRQHAWVLDPAAAEQQEGPDGEGGEPPVLTLAALRREYALAQARAALAAGTPGAQQARTVLLAGAGGGDGHLPGGGAEDIFAQLQLLGLHDAAFQLAEAVFEGTQLTRALERAFASLAAACVRRQLAVGAPAGAAALEAPAAADAAEVDAMETEEELPEAAAAAAGGAAASGADTGGAGAAAEWRRLRGWLQRHGSGEHRHRLHAVILDSMLRTEPAFGLPPWLMAAFQPGAPGGDLAAALRVLMRHGRLADAASLAARQLQHALHAVPSVGMARTSQVCFPQALLDELAARLGATAELGVERRQLADLLQRVRGSALSQTAVIEQLYAH